MKKKNYIELLEGIKKRIRQSQYDALKAVNKELLNLYWDIGRIIVERQKKEKWGKSVVETLARDLQKEFTNIQGFSSRNIWYMRNFYLLYERNTKLQPLVAEISWTHNTVIMDRCEDDLEREFYIRMAKRMGWTKNILIHQIENKTYEKTISNQTNFDKILAAPLRQHAQLAVKDEYTFDFLELEENHNEKELERAILSKINRFLIEMGGSFAFIGNQVRLEVDDKEYFIDLVLYHRKLRCLIAVELKIGEFQPEFVGKMQFYLAALDDLIRLKDENPSIGIILCKDKKKMTIEYALRESKKPIGVAKYKILNQLPKELRAELPNPKQISKLMEEI